jgi:hypothetical protein
MQMENPDQINGETIVVKTSRLAIASLAVAIPAFVLMWTGLSFLLSPYNYGLARDVVSIVLLAAVLAAPAAIVLGIIARVQIRRSGGSLRGNGYAVAGILIAISPVFIVAILAAHAAAYYFGMS